MNFPKYTLETVKGRMTYGYSRDCLKWVFQMDSTCWIIACHGKEQGHKVANIIAGSLKRSGKLDGMGYANINRVINT